MERESPSARSAAHGVRLLTAEPPPLDVLVLVFVARVPNLPPSLAVCFCPLDDGWNPLTGENTLLSCRRVSPNPKLEPLRNVASSLSHAGLTPAWLVGSNSS